MKPNRKHRRLSNLHEPPPEVKEAKALLLLGIGGSDHWNIIENTMKKYPQYFK